MPQFGTRIAPGWRKLTAHLGQVVSLMVCFLSFSSPPSRLRPSARVARAALVGVVLVVAGCGDDAERRAANLADARATLARETAIRNGLTKERHKLAGERKVHEWRAALLTGEYRPPLLLVADRSRIGRAFPSSGIRRLWRLWARRPKAMPWYDNATGALLAKLTNEKYDQLDKYINEQIAQQDRKIAEAEKYLQLVKSLNDGA